MLTFELPSGFELVIPELGSLAPYHDYANSTGYAKGVKSIGFQVVVKILYVSLDDLINCVQLYFRSPLAIGQKFHNRVIPYKLKKFFISSPGDPLRFY